MTILLSALKLATISLLLLELSARAGAGILPFLTRRSLADWEKLSLGLFLGWGAAGLAFLGLALTRIFYPGIIIAFFLCMAVASKGAWSPRLLIFSGIALLKDLDKLGRAIIVLTALVFIYMAFPELVVPDTQVDTFTYHLAAPWQFLQSHGIQLESVYMIFQFPIPMEMVFSLPLALGDDRLARWMVFSALFAANIFFIGFFLRRGEKDGAWLGPLIVLATSKIMPLAAGCKNDAVAVSLFAMGALLWRNRSSFLGPLFLGMCVATKLIYAPLVMIWCALLLPSRGRIFSAMLGLLLPSMPWLIKSYAATGSPLALGDSLPWLYGHLEVKGISLTDLPVRWATNLSEGNIIVFLLLPGLLLFGRWRMAVLACLISQVVTQKLHAEPRYMMASIWLLALLAVRELPRLHGWLKHAAIWLAVFVSLAQIMTCLPESGAAWKDIGLSMANYKSKHLTTYEEMLGILNELNPRRVLMVGEFRTYRIPGRAVFAGVLMKAPLVWKLVNESSDVTRLACKFRQLGADAVCHNYVSSENITFYYSYLPWNQRMLRLYTDYMKSYQTIVGGTKGNDFIIGGFYVYRVHRFPLKQARENVWFLPGADEVFKAAKSFDRNGDWRRALEASRNALELLPDVGQAWTTAGHYFLLNGDVEGAFRLLKPFTEAGMIDTANLPDYASAARRLGQLDLAETLLEESRTRFPSQYDFVCAELGMLFITRARNELGKGRLISTRMFLDRAERYLEVAPDDSAGRKMRRQVSAVMASARGEMHMAIGDSRRAAAYYRQACAIDPHSASAANWRALAQKLDPI